MRYKEPSTLLMIGQSLDKFPRRLSVTKVVDVVHVAPELDLHHGQVVTDGTLGETGKIRVSQKLK